MMNHKITAYQSHIKTSQDFLAQGINYEQIQRKVRSEEIIKVRPGAYISSELWADCPPWDQQLIRVLATAKALPEALISHTSAALVLGFAVPLEKEVHVYAHQLARGKVQQVKKHYVLSKETPRFVVQEGVEVTTPLTTVADSVRILPFRWGVALADSALRLGAVTNTEVLHRLQQSQGRNCRKMRAVANAVSANAESPGESMTRLLLDELGLEYEEQAEIYCGYKRYRCDFLLDKHGIIVEFDGRLKLTNFGASDQVLEDERIREKELQNLGWVVFRTGWDQVMHRPEEFKHQLRKLMQRGTHFSPRPT